MVGSEAHFNIEPTTPLSPEKTAIITDKRFMLLSEFRIGIKLDRKGWKSDMRMIIDYLKKTSGAVDDVQKE